jgi:crotonobetainyl-CoA:carnitine CoA-transferase CaiB-like acyl-CoA transferase
VIGRPELALDGAFATAAVRAAKRVEVDGLIAAWIADRTPQDAMEMLQAAGVPAGAMLRVAELPKFGAFRESGLFQPMFQPGFDESFLVDNRPVRAGRLQTPPLAPAPRLGEHTREIARDLLTLSESEIDRLIAAKVLESPDTP